MIRFLLLGILVLLVARMFWRVFDGVIDAAGGGRSKTRRDTAAAVKLVRDPVCGTHIAPRQGLSLSVSGKTHYFCSDACRTAFERRS